MSLDSAPVSGAQGKKSVERLRWMLPAPVAKRHILLVEDDDLLRHSMPLVLEDAGFDVSMAKNGSDALRELSSGGARLPDLIVLDLRMPIMDGWEFRTRQKNDPILATIPVVAISADGSAQAAAVSADAYLRKPIGGPELLLTVERVLAERQRQAVARMNETERLASLGRLAAGVGHEVNNPLAFLMLNLRQSLEILRRQPSAGPPSVVLAPSPELELNDLKTQLAGVIDMLEDCWIGGERIRQTVGHLQSLSRLPAADKVRVDVHQLIEQAVSMVWNEIRHRARLFKTFGTIPAIRGDAAALGQVFLNLLVNAVRSMPEGDAKQNEIRIRTCVQQRREGSADGTEIMVEISDSGSGIDSALLSRVFEPFFTTKPVGQGTGLGLSISRQSVVDHGGRMTLASEVGRGTVCQVFLPVEQPLADEPAEKVLAKRGGAGRRGRVLVIDDEPLLGRGIKDVLKQEHDVVAVETGAHALLKLQGGDRFDMILCDVMMPDMSGPQFHAELKAWRPELLSRIVFMTGGAFTPQTTAFLQQTAGPVLAKPFDIDVLRSLVDHCVSDDAQSHEG